MSHAKQLHNRRYLHDYLEIITREGLPGNVKNELCLQVQDTVITMVQRVIEAALEEELTAYLGLERDEHLGWGSPTGGDPKWELPADIAYAVRLHCRPPRAHITPGERGLDLAQYHPLRALLGPASRPPGDELLFGAQSAGLARDAGVDAGRGTLAFGL